MQAVLKLISTFRTYSKIPIILFTYFNPLLVTGEEIYYQMKLDGIDGCLVVDLPLEETHHHYTLCRATDFAPILLISPSTSKRIKKIVTFDQGMLYYVCRNRTTEVKTNIPKNFSEKISQIKS